MSVVAALALFPAASSNESNLLARQWAALYHRGKSLALPLAALASASFLYTAYAHYAIKSPRWISRSYVVAGATCIAIAPFTLTIMSANVKALLRASKGALEPTRKERGEDRALDVEGQVSEVVKWVRFNFVRGLMPLAGFGLGLWVTLQ